MRDTRGITLIALIITIIVLLILAGIVISSITAENGILGKAKMAEVRTEEEQAREKLVLVLGELVVDKQTDTKYNQEEYIDKKLTAQEGMTLLAPNIVLVDGWKFEIDRSVPKISQAMGKDETAKPEEEPEDAIPQYVSEGLVLLYDGKNNTGEGHSDNTKIWKNLAQVVQRSSEDIDAELINIEQTENSGWKGNCLRLDGIDDWVKMTSLYYPNMTIEIVVKSLSFREGTEEMYIANIQTGGMLIGKETNDMLIGQVYINGRYQSIGSSKDIVHNKVYSLSTGYNGQSQYFSVDGEMQKQDIAGTFTGPSDNTVFALGVNPDGQGREGVSSHIDIYSVRIYNRCLTEEEIQKNYELDKKRYPITPVEEPSPLGYVTEGLQLLYDGKRNYPYGYNKAATRWRDLSGKGRHVSVTRTSGWNNHALVFDGIDDFARIAVMNYSTITMEVVVESNQEPLYNTGYVISNIESGGYGIFSYGPLIYGGIIRVNNSYQQCVENKTMSENKMSTVSVSYDGNKLVAIQNGNRAEINLRGKVNMSSMPLTLGCNPEGSNSGMEYFKGKIYAVRVYDRALSDEEKNKNYEIDQQRFDI